MTAPQTVSWGGYTFTVHDFASNWNDVPGVYIFAGLSADGQWWQAKYIGQTTSFAARFLSHERWTEATRIGATRVHARVVREDFQRNTIEHSLIEAYNPPLNTRLR